MKTEKFLNPVLGYSYEDLYKHDRLKQLAEDFYIFFESVNKEKYDLFVKYRETKGEGYSPLELSTILIESAPFLSDFLGKLFNIEARLSDFVKDVEYQKDIYEFKKEFVQRKVFRKYKKEDLAGIDWEKLDGFVDNIKNKLFGDLDFNSDEEKYTAHFILILSDVEKNFRWFYEGDKFAPENFQIPDIVKSFGETLISAVEAYTDIGQENENLKIKYILEEIQKWVFAKRFFDKKTKGWVSYFEPEKLDFDELVHSEHPREDFPELSQGPSDHYRFRNGFKLTGARMTRRQILNQVDYCMYCHDRNKDSCSKGLTDRFGKEKTNPLGIELHGCPLDEKISESHFLRKFGFPLASLALVMIDNPMCPGTGHRICNDCMKGCIYQKQEPVNIPEIETSILVDILNLPYGFEIYSLLTRWNPMNVKRPYMLPYNGKNIMVVGAGPAGYTLSQHLLNEGFGVFVIEALKVEPIFGEYTGFNFQTNARTLPAPIESFYQIYKELDVRPLQGFGGVSEYGITVRWDKNFLTVLYIVLMRRENFRLFDGVRFGSSVTIDDAWEMGFDHIAIAAGAGKPTIVNMKNNLARGVRKSSDLLMSINLTGAGRSEKFASLQVQLPAVIIGGGLTAIDTSTETMAYYPVQVLKVLKRYEEIIKEMPEESFWKMYNSDEKNIIQVFIEHGKEIRSEYEKSVEVKREPDIISLIRKWGGVSLIYRKRMQDSPAYRLNHEEIIEAFEEGIFFAENMTPAELVKDKNGAVEKIVFEKLDSVKNEDSSFTYSSSGQFIEMPAKSVMVAAGTSPSTIYEKEYPGTFEMDKRKQYFQMYRTTKTENEFDLEIVPYGEVGFFTSYNKNGKFITYYGDNHPVYVGSVVKAMASAKHGTRKIMELFAAETEKQSQETIQTESRKNKFVQFNKKIEDNFISKIVEINKLTETVSEIIVKSPLAARKLQPGQFFKLQNYEVLAQKKNGSLLSMEGLAATCVIIDKDAGLLSFTIIEKGTSSKISTLLNPEERVILMGPTGSAMDLSENEKVLIAGDGTGHASLLPIIKALKEKNNKIVYFAGFESSNDIYQKEFIEKNTDIIIWCVKDNGNISLRPQDRIFQGSVVDALKHSSMDGLFNFRNVKKIITIGSKEMMSGIQSLRTGEMKEMIGSIRTIAGINSPMQCMMKEVCAQCLQKQIDPVTGKEEYVFSCFNSNQDIDRIDFENYEERLGNNSALEKLNSMYLDHVMKGIS